MNSTLIPDVQFYFNGSKNKPFSDICVCRFLGVFGTFSGEMRRHLFKLLFNTFPIFFWRNASNCWKLLKSSTNNYLRRISPEFFLIFQIFSGEMRGLVKLLKTSKYILSSTHFAGISDFFSTSLKNLASTHFSKKQAKTCTRFSSKICYH